MRMQSNFITLNYLLAAYMTSVKLDLSFPQDMLSMAFELSVEKHTHTCTCLKRMHTHTHTP